MKLWALASGSSGNCFLVESEGTRLLVECGRPLKDVLRYLDHCRVAPEDLHGILLTHAHGDHSKSARELSDEYRLPVYASEGTLGCQTLRDSPFAHPIYGDKPFEVGQIEIRPFAVPHDCFEPLGFRFAGDGGQAAIVTDLGWVPASVQRNLLDLDLLVLEANYDPHLLYAGRYPDFLKRRVAGRNGHLSNDAAAEAIAACGDRAPGEVWLAHISENNNTPKTALSAVQKTLLARGLAHVSVAATRHRRPSLRWDSTNQARQLALF